MTRTRPNRGSALIVINRQAGTLTDELVEAVAGRCVAHFHEVNQVEASTAPLAELIEPHLGDGSLDLVIAVGGDGTVRAVAAALVAARTEPSLLVVPAGSGNSLYSLLWGEIEWTEALDRVLAGSASRRRLDLIRLAELDRLALLGVNVGLVAEVAREVERMKSAATDGNSDEDRYWQAFGEVLQDLHCAELRVQVDGRPLHEGVASLVTVGGIRNFGRGAFNLLPRSIADDGLLDVCLVEAETAEEIARLATFVPTGSHVDEADVHYDRGRRITVERIDGRPLTIEHDGDPHEVGNTVTLEVLTGPLPFYAESGSATERG